MHIEETPTSPLVIIPLPVSLKRGKGHFVLDADTILVADACTSAAAAALADAIRPSAGFIAQGHGVSSQKQQRYSFLTRCHTKGT